MKMNLLEKISFVVVLFIIVYSLGYYKGKSRGRSRVLSYLRRVIPNVDITLEDEEKRESLGYFLRL